MSSIVSLPQVDVEHLQSECRILAEEKYGNPPSSYIASRLRAGYFSPEDHYEALVNRLISSHVTWLDVGCGRAPLPGNLRLSSQLSRRCSRMVGIDPDPTIEDNRFVHERHQLPFEQYAPSETFDLVTARMVVEHVKNPAAFSDALTRVTRLGSIVVLFTVNWWSLTSLAAYFSPMWVHHWIKDRLWKTEREDTFHTEFKMNRRITLRTLMHNAGFREYYFQLLPDASLFWRLPYIRDAELVFHRVLRRIGLPYIDTCILAAYQRVS